MRKLLISAVLITLPTLGVAPTWAADLELQGLNGGMSWLIAGSRGAATLTVKGEGDYLHRASFPAGVSPFFLAPGDGSYRWQLQVAPVESSVRRDGVEMPASAGGFVEEGLIVVQGGVARAVSGDVGNEFDVPRRDQVIPDDLIVQGSGCFGFDCVNNESFGFDTIRLKENNLRIKFEDTSVGTFPTTDWQLTANDSASGGANKFSIEDITSSRVPFTVTGGAPTNAVFVDSTGRVGLRTATPVLDLHISTSNTPAIRLEQTSAGGFTAQTWDIAGNEANFFVRDVTSGSRLPFRIRPGAATSSLDISADGDIGMGTASPSAKLHVVRGGALTDPMAIFENNQAARMDLRINSTVNGGVDTTWFFQADSDANRTFKISKFGGGGTIVTINNRLDQNGVTFKVDGSIQATNVIFASSRELKTDFQAVSAKEVLEKVAGLDIGQWRFKHEAESLRHIGPIAEDFAATFALGTDGKTINATDANGVALKAIQGLYEELQQIKRENAELRALLSAARETP